MAGFGIKRLVLPATEYGLDEEGWLEIRRRLTVRAALRGHAALGDGGDEKAIEATLAMMIVGWSIKIDGQELPYSPENVMELPVECLLLVQKELESLPLTAAASKIASGPASKESAPGAT